MKEGERSAAAQLMCAQSGVSVAAASALVPAGAVPMVCLVRAESRRRTTADLSPAFELDQGPRNIGWTHPNAGGAANRALVGIFVGYLALESDPLFAAAAGDRAVHHGDTYRAPHRAVVTAVAATAVVALPLRSCDSVGRLDRVHLDSRIGREQHSAVTFSMWPTVSAETAQRASTDARLSSRRVRDLIGGGHRSP
jgi:hypothetical protein